jgi:hypothetical protein
MLAVLTGCAGPAPTAPTPAPVPTQIAPGVPTSAAPRAPSAPTVLVVGNTQGIGVYIRPTPSMAGQIKAWPDGTRMTVIGPDQQAEGMTWKNVRDPDGNVGWVPAQYLPEPGQAAPPVKAAPPQLLPKPPSPPVPPSPGPRP